MVITIIVLLILAGVAISMLSGENGILTRAAEAKERTEEAQEQENISLIDMEVEIDFSTENTPYKFKNGYLTNITVTNKEIETVESVESKLPDGYTVCDVNGNSINNKGKTKAGTGMILKKDNNPIGSIIVFGDVDNDCIIDSIDATAIGIYLEGGSKVNIAAADVNHDGIVNKYDVHFILDGCTIEQNAYAQSSNSLIIENQDNMRNKYIELLSSKYTIEYITWDVDGDTMSDYAITNTTDKTTIEDILELLPDNAAIYRYTSDEVFKKGEDKNKTELIQENDEIIIVYKESKDKNGNIKYDYLDTFLYVVKQK